MRRAQSSSHGPQRRFSFGWLKLGSGWVSKANIRYIILCTFVGISIATAISSYARSQETERFQRSFFQEDFGRVIQEGQQTHWYGRSPEAIGWLVLSLVRAGRPIDGQTLAREAGASFDQGWRNYLTAASLIFEESAKLQALESSAAALAANPQKEEFIWLRAETLRLRHEFNDAAKLLASSPSLETSSLLNITLASVLIDVHQKQSGALGRPGIRSAAALFATASRLDPADPRPWYLWGRYLGPAGAYTEASDVLEEAAKRTTSPRIHSEYWLALQQDRSLSEPLRREKIYRDALRLIKSRGRTAEGLYIVVTAFREFGNVEEATAISTQLRREFPQSHEAAQERLRDVRLALSATVSPTAAKLAAMRAELQALNEQLQTADVGLRRNTQQALVDVIARDPSAPGEVLLSAVHNLINLDRRDANSITTGVAVLADRGIYLEEAVLFGKLGLRSAERYVDSIGLQNATARDEALRQITGRLHLEIGRAELGRAQQGPAERHLTAASELVPDLPRPFEALAELALSRKDHAAARKWLAACASLSFRNTVCRSKLETLYASQVQDRKQAARLAARDVEAYRRLRSAEDRRSLADKAVPLRFASLGNEQNVIRAPAGRLVVVVFWGSWCQACRREYPQLEALADAEFRGQQPFIVLASDERNVGADFDWMKLQARQFDLVKGRALSRDMGVIGVPTVWVFDRSGRPAFKTMGYSDFFVSEMKARMALL